MGFEPIDEGQAIVARSDLDDGVDEVEVNQRRTLRRGAIRRLSLTGAVATAAAGGLFAAPLQAQPGPPIRLVDMPDWSLVAWTSGSEICFLWRGEPDRIETLSGCRARPHSSISLLVGETGKEIRFAGLSATDVAYVAASVKGRVFSVVATRRLPAALGQAARFFFLRLQPQLLPTERATAHWTLVALDKHRRPLVRLRA